MESDYSTLEKILNGSFQGTQATDVETRGPELRKVKAVVNNESASFAISANGHYGLMQKFVLSGDTIPKKYSLTFGGTVVCTVDTKIRKHLVEEKGIHLRIPPIVVHPFLQLMLYVEYESPVQQELYAFCEYLAYDVSRELSLYQAYPTVDEKLYENEDLTGEGLWILTSKSKSVDTVTIDSSTELDTIDNLPAFKFRVKGTRGRYGFYYRLSVDSSRSTEHIVKGRANTNLVVSQHGHMLLKLDAEE